MAVCFLLDFGMIAKEMLSWNHRSSAYSVIPSYVGDSPHRAHRPAVSPNHPPAASVLRSGKKSHTRAHAHRRRSSEHYATRLRSLSWRRSAALPLALHSIRAWHWVAACNLEAVQPAVCTVHRALHSARNFQQTQRAELDTRYDVGPFPPGDC